MGLSIHYQGRFREGASLSKLINEVKDFVKACDWEYHVFENKFPQNIDENLFDDNIYGISFSAPSCEPVWLTFLSNRKMSNPMLLEFYGKTENPAEKDYLYMLATKTQFAGIEVHKFIIQLFKYLVKNDYFETFQMIDEGQYWETGDEKLLEETFKKYTSLIENFALAIDSIPKTKDESYENYFERLASIIHKKNRGNKSD